MTRSSPQPDPDIASQPVVLGKYTLVRQIGIGGMAQVWLARKAMGDIEKAVALKVSSDFVGFDPQRREGILNEIRVAGRMRHSNIVSVMDAGEHGGVVYIELELIDGHDLRQFAEDLWRREQQLPFSIVAYILRAVLEGLNYAHVDFMVDGVSQRVIHRDLTPSNVILSTSGEVKIIDFGIGKYFDEHTSGAHLKGKPRYMAPEHAAGTTAPSIDLFPVGGILYELVEGRRFRDGVPAGDLYPMAAAGWTPRITRVDTPPAFVRLYDALVAPDPYERVHSAVAAMAMLDLWDGRPAQASELRALVRIHTGGTHSGYTRGEFVIPSGLETVVAVANARAQEQAPTPPRPTAARGKPEPTVDAPRVTPVVVTPAAVRAAANDAEVTAIEPRPGPAVERPAFVEAPHREPTELLPAPDFQRWPFADVPVAVVTCAPVAVTEPTRAASSPTARRHGGVADDTAFVVARGRVLRWHMPVALAGVLATVLGVATMLARDVEAPESTVPVSRSRASHAIDADVDAEASVRPSAGPTLRPHEVVEPGLALPPSDVAATPVLVPHVVPATEVPVSDAAAPDSAGQASEATEAPMPAIRKPAPKAPAPKVKLRVVPMFAAGEIQIGKKVHVVGTSSYDLLLTVGKHGVKWRPTGESAWVDRPALVLAVGRDYLLHVGAKGTKLSSKEAP